MNVVSLNSVNTNVRLLNLDASQWEYSCLNALSAPLGLYDLLISSRLKYVIVTVQQHVCRKQKLIHNFLVYELVFGH